MTTKVVRIFDTNNSPDLGDTLDGQIDVVWGLIAALETLCRESGYDAYAKVRLQLPTVTSMHCRPLGRTSTRNRQLKKDVTLNDVDEADRG